MFTVASLIRCLAAEVGIPEAWKKDVQRIKERGREVSPQQLIQEKGDELKKKLIDRTIKKPGLFLRDTHRILTYINTDVKDPAKHGLSQDLSSLANQVTSEARKGEEIKLPAEKQTNFITTAEKLKDDGTLLNMLSELFNEQYKTDQYKKRSSLAEIIRSFADLFH